MGTTVSSSSPSSDLGAWGAERIAQPRIALLGLFIAGLGFVAEAPTSVLEALLRVVLVAVLVVQLRLWDDVADREHDRVARPGRAVPAPDAPVLLALAAAAAAVIVLLAQLDHALLRIGAY